MHHSSHHSHHSHHSHGSGSHGRFSHSSGRVHASSLPAEEESASGVPDGVPDLGIDHMIDEALEEPVRSEDSLLPVDVEESLNEEADAVHLKSAHRPKRSAGRKLLTVLLVIALVIGCLGIGVLWTLSRGKRNMTADYEKAQIALPTDDERIVSDDAGQTVRYNGKLYRFNPNLTTILFLGIDREDLELAEQTGDGGQADVIMLVVEDTETGRMKILNISRDTYAEYMRYTKDGVAVDYEKLQICLSYAYGDGRELSCENTKEAVQKLLYGMPISRYIAMDMDGVVAANEAVGGVELESMIDLQRNDGSKAQAGERITLHDREVISYLRHRGHDIDGNNRRIERGKQYASRFAATAVQQVKSDFGVIAKLYRTVMPYVVTDLELGDLAYLAQIYIKCGVAFEFRNISGEMDWLPNQYGNDVAVLYPDEDQLFETILDLFYTEVVEGS